MRQFLDFFHQIGKLNEKPRRGWVLIGIKNPASIADHSFRMAIMGWVLGKGRKLNTERVIKMALIHDICELYSGDITPYDYKPLPKDKKEWPKIFDCWPRFSKSKKIKNFIKKHEKEKKGLIKITSGLSSESRKEILQLWHEYEKGITKEARFLRQVNRLETLLQALEYSYKNKKRPFDSWWIGSEEMIDDPVLIKFMEEMAGKFYIKKKKRKKAVRKV